MLTEKIDKDFFTRILRSKETSSETKRDILFVMNHCILIDNGKGLNRTIADKLVLEGVVEVMIDVLLTESDLTKQLALDFLN